jgi:hypothetical protein
MQKELWFLDARLDGYMLKYTRGSLSHFSQPGRCFMSRIPDKFVVKWIWELFLEADF